MGLACAYDLLKRGHKVTVLEAGPVLGGMSVTFDLDGIDLERFYHFVCMPDTDLFDTLEEFGLSHKLQWRETSMGFFFEGKLYKWGAPQHLLSFPKLDFISKFRYGLLVMYAKSIKDWRPLDKVEATSWVRRWVGDKAYEVLWRPLFDLKFYDYAQNLSAAWIGTRIARMGNSRKNLFQEQLGFLEGGSQTLIDEWERRIRDMGGDIVLNAKVEQVCTANGQVSGVQVAGETQACDRVISTIPLPYVPAMVPDLAPQERENIQAINNIGVVCVVFKLSQKITEHFWLNINDASIQNPGFIEYSNLRPLPSHILYAPFYLPNHNPKHQQTDEEFVAEVSGYIKKINPQFNDSWIEAVAVNRYHLSQPICPPGFYDMIPPMKTSIANFFMADTCYHYPEDRAISHSIGVAKDLVKVACDGS